MKIYSKIYEPMNIDVVLWRSGEYKRYYIRFIDEDGLVDEHNLRWIKPQEMQQGIDYAHYIPMFFIEKKECIICWDFYEHQYVMAFLEPGEQLLVSI